MTKRALGALVVLCLAATTAWSRLHSPHPPVVVAAAVDVVRQTTTVAPTTTVPPAPPAQPVVRGPVVPRAPLPPAVPALSGPFWVAAATGNAINVYDAPNGNVVEQITGINEAGTTRVLLVKERVNDDWIHAYLPTRPNMHTGYVRVSEVSLSTVDTQIKVELGYHRLTAWAGEQMIAQYPVAVGAPRTPTPSGIYYLQELIRTPNARGAYGPYVFGLSAHSNVFESFGGGDGLVGLHGTNQPGSIGRSASHGCIRVQNAAIVNLVNLLPVGTPIVIV